MYIGVNSNPDCSLDEIKNAGFTHVMISPNKHNLEDSIKKTLEKGLKISFVHLPFDSANSLWVKGGTNERYIDLVINQLETCSRYNIPIAVMHPTRGSSIEKVIKPNRQGLLSMYKILEAAEKYNVVIALENLDRVNFRSFKYLMKHINSPYLKFCYDAGHHNLYYPKKDILKKYGDRIVAVHLHDNLMNWKYGYDYSVDLHLIPFDGKVDYNKVCKNIAKTNYDNVILLELHKTSDNDIYPTVSNADYLEKAYKSATKLDNLIKELRNIKE